MARTAVARPAPARSAKPRPSGGRKASSRSAATRSRARSAAPAKGRAASGKAPAAPSKGRAAPAKGRPSTRKSTRPAAPRRSPHSSNGRSPRSARSRSAGGAVALPLPVRVLRAPAARAIRARGGTVVDALLHGQGWIALIGVLLAGIVFCNVYLLQLNRDIAATSQKAAAVKRENARLRLDVARLGSSERIQLAAAQLGLVLPAPGEVRYLRAHPALDGGRAAKLVEPPGLAAAPAPVAPEPLAPEPPAPTVTTPPATTDPAAVGQTATDPAAAPVAQDQSAPLPADPAAG
jgi:cell division protein FtsL